MNAPKLSSLSLIFLALTSVCFSQLTVDAGRDTAFCAESSEFAVIGGNPSAKGGVPPYVYTWSAEYKHGSHVYTSSFMLEDTTVANPVFKKGSIPDSVVLYLNVQDAADSIATDSVQVRLSNFGGCLGECRHYIKLGDSVQLWHCIFGGIPPLTFLWSPTSSLSGGTSESPWAKPLSNTTYELIITDSVGCQTSSACIVFVDPSTINPRYNNIRIIQVYPIPARNEINVVFDNPRFSNSVLEILSSNGSLIRKINVNDPVISIGVQDLLPGIYIYKWKTNGDMIETGRFVIK